MLIYLRYGIGGQFDAPSACRCNCRGREKAKDLSEEDESVKKEEQGHRATLKSFLDRNRKVIP